MKNKLQIKMYAFTIDCQNVQELAQFYANLLNWEVVFSDKEWGCVGAPHTAQGSYPGILFQHNPDFVAPVWPDEPNAQQQMAHLDFAVNDLEEAVQHALSCGASIAHQQFSDQWKVMIDLAGHPFCLCLMSDMFESEHFSLL